MNKATAIKVGQWFTGTVYRADTGYKNDRTATALDVVKYETESLGNDIHFPPELTALCLLTPASRCVWVAPLKTTARRYGADVETVELVAALVIGEDGDGGYLVLLADPIIALQPVPKTVTLSQTRYDELLRIERKYQEASRRLAYEWREYHRMESIEKISAYYRRLQGGFRFDNSSAHGSRWGAIFHGSSPANFNIFIESEPDFYGNDRRYSVRQLQIDGSIQNVSEHLEYKTSIQARNAAIAYIRAAEAPAAAPVAAQEG